jgi:hypothetical protein
MQPYLDEANLHLKDHRMALDQYPTDRPLILPYKGAVVTSAGDPGTVRNLAHQAWPRGRGIPIIFCEFLSNDTAFGETILDVPEHDDARGGVHWLPFCLINTNKKSDSETTILHEMIHAAYAQSVQHDADPDSVFYKDNTEIGVYEIRTFTKKHAELLRQSYFAAVK